MARIAIFDYGAGNIFSLKNALERHGARVDVHTDVAALGGYDGVFLPGVGNFDPAMRSITAGAQGTAAEVFGRAVGDTTPVFGICLGMEMFFERSEEGVEAGLGVMDGSVVVLPDTLKVPHMGWNSLEIVRPDNAVLEGVEDGAWVYFVHSYRAALAAGPSSSSAAAEGGEEKDRAVVVAESDYGVRIPAIVQRGGYFGTQFHPEKSGAVGALMLKNFLRECSR